MKIVDLYIRVSTDEQAEKGYSQRHQEEILRKYCSLHNITIRKIILEDHSAKTFNRPEWNKYLAELKKRKHKVENVLFTKWDRFSRNAGDAYQMINTLRKVGIEPQAIEQPLDLSIPENKMMLAFYLAAPEVENDRRALNTFYGMRRAKKEGRIISTAPLGYVNKTNENGKKYVAIEPKKATILIEAFETVATGMYNVEQIWKEAKRKGLTCSRSTFWTCLRNSVYCGKIFIPAFKDEEATYVKGQHEPLISEALFYEVQDILDGKKRNHHWVKVRDNFPLRGFLTCPDCGKLLTASTSKGRTKRYDYYHCIAACGVRYQAEIVNTALVDELRKYKPHPATIVLYKKVVSDVYKSSFSQSNSDKKELLLSIEEQNKRVQKARELLLNDAIEPVDFKIIKTESEQAISRAEAKLTAITSQKDDIDLLLEKACKTLGQLDTLYTSSDTATQRRIVGSIYREKLVFTENEYRTTRLNEAVQLIYSMGKGFSRKEKGETVILDDFSCKVVPTGIEPVSKV
jgi:site-specific DNA recombinase